MSDLFPHALKRVLAAEGGFSNKKNDKGGATKFGISLRFLKQIDGDVTGDGHVDIKDIQALTKKDASEFYREHFWEHYRLDEIPDVETACKALDVFVNMRGIVAGKVFQRALRAVGAPVVEDGIVGSKTIRVIQHATRSQTGSQRYLSAVKSESAGVYRLIVANDDKQSEFIDGWLNRAYR